MKRTTRLFLLLTLCFWLAGCAGRPEKLLDKARSKLAEGDWNAAIDLADSILEKHPNSAEAVAAKDIVTDAQRLSLFNDVMTKYEAKDWSEAIATAQSFLSEYPNSAESSSALALIEDADRQLYLEAAKACFAEAERKFSEGDYEAAINAATNLKKEYPDSPEGEQSTAFISNCNAAKLYAEALEYKKEGNYAAAIARFITISKSYPNADIYSEAMEVRDECSALYANELLEELETAFSSQDWDLSVLRAKRIIELVPDSDTAAAAQEMYDVALEKQTEAKAKELMDELKNAYSAENWNEVIRVANKVIILLPGTTEADTARQYQATAEDRIQEAEDRKQEALRKEVQSTFRISTLKMTLNYSGGATAYISFTNKSSKTISSITFGVSFCDSSGKVLDIVMPSYVTETKIIYLGDDSTYRSGKGAESAAWGPFYPSGKSTIVSVKLASLTIKYSDGSTKDFSKDELPYLQY